MKKRTNILHYSLLIVGLFIVFASSCKKDDDKVEPKIPVLATTEVTEICQLTAQGGGTISSDEGFAVTARGICWNTTGNPTVEDNKTTDGEGTGNFTSKLTGLTVGTTYYVRAYATNNQGTAYGNTLTFETLGSTFTDSRDGNVYKMVTIGDQIWMAENLRYLPSVVGPATGSTTTPLYYVYDYDGTSVTDAKATANYSSYGVLYNWPATMAGSVSSDENPSGVQGVCPTGWHIPSDAEWVQLTNYLGGQGVAGGKLKETGTEHWQSPNNGATNESGFTALPGGCLGNNGAFFDIGINSRWWGATESGFNNSIYRATYFSSSEVVRSDYNKEYGFSVRCVKD